MMKKYLILLLAAIPFVIYSQNIEKPLSVISLDTIEKEEPIFVMIDKMPEFRGGIKKLYKFLQENISYPEEQLELGVQGRVICQFIVNKDGSIEDITVVMGVCPELDAEAVRVLKRMPKWKPGEQDGKKVRVKYTLPIVFKIEE